MIIIIQSLFLLFLISSVSSSCSNPFQGFGVFLGQSKSFNGTRENIRTSVLDKIHDDLNIRYLRTEYPPGFSLSDGSYEIKCVDMLTCTWITMHSLLSSSYPDFDLYVSIWSPPKYMLTRAQTLKPEFEDKYYWYLSNITEQAQTQYNLTIGRLSFVNEPEYFDAPWDHCFMLPDQVCRLAKKFDHRMKVCPETSYFWLTKSYLLDGGCNGECKIVATHGYKPWIHGGSITPQLRVHYDGDVNENDLDQPIWITELGSTLSDTEIPNEMDFAFDLAKSIINFVGSTCVQRVYHWLAFTNHRSGESLMWSVNGSDIILPKKYWAYRHFTRASSPGNRTVSLCSQPRKYSCLAFDDNFVYVNRKKRADRLIEAHRPAKICCTEAEQDEKCYDKPTELPAKSICSTAK